MGVRQLSDGRPDGTVFGQNATDLIGFYGVATPVAQRSGATQAAVATTASTGTSPNGFTTTTQADAIVTLVNEMRAVLVATNLMPGA